ncbi:MAG: DUF433 domain-containing protein [Spirochaetales bacterium]|nr:DUF433 domain-containing protein [Spirochaetales bacterium]MBE7439185.1 DUF433 domain-containing protein [Spirochaetales bacterium]
MEYRSRLSSDPNVLLGKPVIRGTRITVALVLDKLSEGETFEELLESYPDLTREDILACLAYSHDVVSREALIAD